MQHERAATANAARSGLQAAGARLQVNTTARLTKLPRFFSSSLLLRPARSAHRKSVSMLSGRVASK